MSNDELKELSATLAECGRTLIRIAAALLQEKKEEQQKAEEKPQAAPEKVHPEAEVKEKQETRKLTLEDVRKVAADKARQGYTEEVRNLIHKYGADRLSAVDAEKYPGLLKELEAVHHAG